MYDLPWQVAGNADRNILTEQHDFLQSCRDTRYAVMSNEQCRSGINMRLQREMSRSLLNHGTPAHDCKGYHEILGRMHGILTIPLLRSTTKPDRSLLLGATTILLIYFTKWTTVLHRENLTASDCEHFRHDIYHAQTGDRPRERLH